MHAYEVVCSGCGAFFKWGTQSELDLLEQAGKDYEKVSYEPPPPLSSLEGFFV